MADKPVQESSTVEKLIAEFVALKTQEEKVAFIHKVGNEVLQAVFNVAHFPKTEVAAETKPSTEQ